MQNLPRTAGREGAAAAYADREVSETPPKNLGLPAGARREFEPGMARKHRVQTPNLIRHVMARGNGRMTIFLDDLDYRTFTQLFRETVEDFKIKCWNYCLMPNHYHATLLPLMPNISAAIQYLNSTYAQWWNRQHGKTGHVFQGRFKAQIVQEDGHALTLSRYVALNPVRAQLVKHPEEWRWSSYGSLIGLRPIPSFLDANATLTLFGDGEASLRRQRFADFVLAGCEDETDDDRIRSNNRILGDAAFTTSINGGPLNQSHAARRFE